MTSRSFLVASLLSNSRLGLLERLDILHTLSSHRQDQAGVEAGKHQQGGLAGQVEGHSVVLLLLLPQLDQVSHHAEETVALIGNNLTEGRFIRGHIKTSSEDTTGMFNTVLHHCLVQRDTSAWPLLSRRS